jgi:4-amino-4-deoxy-L-arabinose transferase-like glycosyltransferase
VPRLAALPVLLACAAAIYFVALGSVSIWDANEAFYVETPREMIEAHDFINPSFNYLPRFNKPILSYWIVAAFYKLFGVSVGVQRFPIALGAMLILACAFVLGRLAGEGRREAGLWAAVGLAAAPRLVMFARRIFIDIWITAFMAMTLTFFALSEAYPDRRRQYLILMYASVGLGVLTKGPIAIVLPGLAFAVYLLWHREVGRIRQMMLPLGTLIVLAIVLPWYVRLYLEHGSAHIMSFLVSENLERYTSGLGVRQQRGMDFYLPVILSDSFPISVFLVAAAALAFRTRTRTPTFSFPRTHTLLWCWIVAIVVFFSLSAGKQDLYIFPIVPAVAALGGAVLAVGMCEPPWRAWVRWTLAIAALLLAIAGAGVWWLFETAGRVYELRGATAIGACALAGGLAAAWLALRWKTPASALVLMATMIAVNYVFVIGVLPDFERYKPVPPISEILKPRLRPSDVVADYQVALPSMVYYLRRHVDEYFEEAPFVHAMLSNRRVYAVLSDDDFEALKPTIGARVCVLYRRQTFDVKLKNVLARQPPPELLLITNDCP